MPQASATSTAPPTATSSSTTTQPPQPAQPLDFNSMMAQMLGSLGQQPPQQAQSTTSTTTTPTTPATPPNPLGALSQLLSGMGNPASGGPAMSGVLSQLLANRPPGVPQGGATGGAQSGPTMNNNPFGALMAQLLSGGMNTSTAPSTDRPADTSNLFLPPPLSLRLFLIPHRNRSDHSWRSQRSVDVEYDQHHHQRHELSTEPRSFLASHGEQHHRDYVPAPSTIPTRFGRSHGF